MDEDLLSQFLFRAKKEGKIVQLYLLSNTPAFVNPEDKWDIKAGSLVTNDCIFDLNNIVCVELVDSQHYLQVVQQVERLNKLHGGIL